MFLLMNILLFVLFLQERVELVAEAGLPIMITGKTIVFIYVIKLMEQYVL